MYKVSRRCHFIIGLYVSLVFGVIYTPRFGFLLAIALAFLKEYDDQKRYQRFDWKNTVSTWIGSFVGFLIAGILTYF